MKTLELIFSLTLLTIISTIIIGTIGFMVLEGFSLLDSLYFVITTLTTVGYGDIFPITPYGKVLVVIIILVGVLSFLGLAATVIDLLIERREKNVRNHRLNMINGAFFSEVGIRTLRIFSDADPNINDIQNTLLVTDKWSEKEFFKASKRLKSHKYEIEIKKIDLENLRSLLMDKKIFLLDQLELPLLLERYNLTELLRALFHLTEELSYRSDLKNLPLSDLDHLSQDIKRSYIPLVNQWLTYMEYLKNHYPYLFSLAMRTNPFDPNASPVIN